MVIHGTIGMWKHNLLRFGRKRRYKPAKKNSRSESTEELCHHEARSIDWTNPGKCICECSRERYRRIGKGRRSREPVCAGDVKTDRYRNRFGTQTRTAPDHAQQAERCNEFAKKLPATGAGVLRDLYEGFAKHQVRRAHADKCTQYLGDDIRRDIAPANPALRGISKRYRRIEVRARDWPECENQGHQRSARGQRIGKQGNGYIAVREPLPHDAGANDGRKKERGS